MAARPLTLDALREIAVDRGGRCLSTNYKNCTDRLQWECAEGHRWEALAHNVARGSWCPVCARRRQGGNQYTITIGTLKDLARSRGGECLSRRYRGPFTKYLWRCAEGHEWKAIADSVRRGSWCPECRWSAQAHSIEFVQEFAADHGWKCLSQHYETNQTKLKWECERGHRWEATFNVVQSMPHCPRCLEEDHRSEGLATCRAIAESRGGKCLATDFLGTRYFMEWECAEGHRWSARVAQVKKGTWCPVCVKLGRRSSLAEFQELARARGGECLSKTYVPNGAKLRWRYAKGHKWEAAPLSVRSGCWCPVCAHQRRSGHTIEDMQEVAAKHGGRCLSTEYYNNRMPLEWECAAGHRWEAPFLAIRSGSWCARCVPTTNEKASIMTEKEQPPPPIRHRRTLEEIVSDLRQAVADRGGQWLAGEAVSRVAHIELECAKGHRWEARVGNIVDGSWCRVCGKALAEASWKNRFGLLDLDDADEVALWAESQGLTYVQHDKLRLGRSDFFRCANGHMWEVSRSYSKLGSWCPVCGTRGEEMGVGRGVK